MGAEQDAQGTQGTEGMQQPSAPPAPEAQGAGVGDGKLQKLAELLAQFEITIAEAGDLAVLADYEVVVIADDSGSMNSRTGQASFSGPRTTRWTELQETLKTMIEISLCVTEGGVDVYFLNRPEILAVTDAGDPRLLESFANSPSGTTPLTQVVHRVVAQKSVGDAEKPVLVLIATDGEPDGGPRGFKMALEGAIQKKSTSRTFKFQILACTDDDDGIEWLNEFDNKYKEVDVTDDYHSERKQILAAGKVTSFKRSDWVIKALLGPILSKFDSLDEPNQGKSKHNDLTPLIYFFLLLLLARLLRLM